MPDGTFWEIASFFILAIATIITLYRWIIPRIQKWRGNRLYSLSNPKELSSKRSSNANTLEVGRNYISLKLKVHKDSYVDNADIYFSAEENSHKVSESIIEKVNVNREIVLGYRHKGEIIPLEIEINAKIPWHGYIMFYAIDEDGWWSYCSHPIKIIASTSQVIDEGNYHTE